MINILELSQDDNSDDNETLYSDCLAYTGALFSPEAPGTTTDIGESPTVPFDKESNANATDEPPLDQMTTGPNTDQQISDSPTLLPTAPETASWTGSATNLPTGTPSPCQSQVDSKICSRVINITWLPTPPFMF